MSRSAIGFLFRADGRELTSDSTLRFRSRDEVAESLEAAAFRVCEVRDAPDRPGLELVFVAQRLDGTATTGAVPQTPDP